MNASALLLIAPLLLIEAFFSGSEIALLSADKLKLKADSRRGSAKAKLALELANHPERVLSITLVMTCLCVSAISALITLYILSRGLAHSELISVAITSPLIVLFGELLPKTLYRHYADKLAPWVATPVHICYWAIYPVTRVISSYTSRLASLLGPLEELIAGKRQTTREEIRSLLSYTKRESEIKTSEKRMIKRIFDFKDSEAKHALIPLVKVEAIEDTATIEEAIKRFQCHRHSRMPVYSDSIANIIGVLEVADLFGVTNMKQPIRNHVTPARYVAETQSLEDLLFEMRREHEELVVVVDEYGGATGILTCEDIVEEIVGEISDEYDSESQLFKEHSQTSWSIMAKMEIKQINEQLQLEIPEGDYETLGGFLLQQFGRIPEIGYELYFDTTGHTLKFTIRKANPRHIETVTVERIQKEN